MRLSEREYQRRMREVNNQIFRGICTYLIGNKWTGKYTIDNSGHNHQPPVIRIKNNELSCSIYFSYDIRISVGRRYKVRLDANAIGDSWRRYYSFYDNLGQCNFPDDVDDYVRVSTDFLREFLRHMYSVKAENEGCRTRGFDDCPFQEFSECCTSHMGLLQYEYNYQRDRDLIKYVTDVMKSKTFKRSRTK